MPERLYVRCDDVQRDMGIFLHACRPPGSVNKARQEFPGFITHIQACVECTAFLKQTLQAEIGGPTQEEVREKLLAEIYQELPIATLQPRAKPIIWPWVVVGILILLLILANQARIGAWPF